MSAQPIEQRLANNFRNTLVLSFCHVFLVIMPIAVPFFQSKGLTMQQVFTLQAVFALVVLVSEIPSGYLADLLGRRRTLLLGALAAGIGNTLLLGADGFAGLVLYEIALGIGVSLISGADLAVLYDTEVALGRGESQQSQIVGRLYSVRTLSEALAAVFCSVLLLVASMDLVVWVQVVVGWVPLWLAFRIVEPPGARMPSAGHLQNVTRVLRYLLTHSRILRLVFLALSVWSLTTFYAVWLLQQLWQDQQIPLEWFGYLWAILSVVSALSGRWAHRLEARFGPTTLLIMIGIAPALGYIGLDLFGAVGGFVASLSFFVSRGVGLVILQDALNRRVQGHFRATANSLASFGFRGAFVVTGPWVGYLLDLWGMSTTLWLLAGATLLIFAVLIVPLFLAVRAPAPLPEGRKPKGREPKGREPEEAGEPEAEPEAVA